MTKFIDFGLKNFQLFMLKGDKKQNFCGTIFHLINVGLHFQIQLMSHNYQLKCDNFLFSPTYFELNILRLKCQ